MDDPATLLAAQSDPLGFLQNMGSHVIIDEVQRAPELFLSIKKLIDEDRQSRRIVLTGSADVMTLPRVADSLAGRIEIQHLWPLSQCEILGTPPRFLQTLTSANEKFTASDSGWKDMIQMVTAGGYPEALQRKTSVRRTRWFESYITSILQKDIRDLSNIEGLTQIPNILHLLAVRVGSTINFSDIGRLSGIKTATLHRYLALLEQVFLIRKIPAWTPNTEGQFVKSPKILLNDTGLLCYLLGETETSLMNNRVTAGKLLENFALLEVLKQLSWHDEVIRPYHFSIHQGAEVDLVLEDSYRRVYGIEIKSAATLYNKDFKGLKKLAELTGDRFQRGIVLYTGNQVLGGFGGKNLLAVPLGALWG